MSLEGQLLIGIEDEQTLPPAEQRIPGTLSDSTKRVN